MLSEPARIHQLLESDILTRVTQPGQYTGGESGSVSKNPGDIEVSVALCFPDTYALGMSHLGYQILYHIVNSRPWAAAERAYAPWPDMQQQMGVNDIPLFTVESFTPVREFDIVGFTLQSELLYTNVLMMLDLARIPLSGAGRTENDALVIAGGPGAMAPEPLAAFVDAFFVGDAEESLPEFLELLRDLKKKSFTREEILETAAKNIKGVYVPSLYRPVYCQGGQLKEMERKTDAVPERVQARRVKDLDAAPFPTKPIVPLVETAHERINLEIMRGCSRGCRFCHAGMTGRPVRHKSPDTIYKQAVESYWNTGYDEIALTSLSSSDYPHLPELLDMLTEYFTPLNVSITLPSLRVSDRIEKLVGPLRAVRKSGLTLAPEAGTERMREVIRKDITNRDLFDGAAAAARAGWRLVKLYFMIGLPGEEKEDCEAIGVLCNDIIKKTGEEPSVKNIKLNVTISPFVPKPHTPLQWEAMTAPDVLRLRWDGIRNSGGKRIRYKLHDPAQSVVEAALARGDRRMGNLLLQAYKAGARFDAWNDMFDARIWNEVLAENGIHTGENECHSHPNSPFRRRSLDEFLPWDHIDCGTDRGFLIREREKANIKGGNQINCKNM